MKLLLIAILFSFTCCGQVSKIGTLATTTGDNIKYTIATKNCCYYLPVKNQEGSGMIAFDTAIQKPCKTDSLKTALFLANYKLERVKYYLKICKRNPRQVKFLMGWINRAVK